MSDPHIQEWYERVGGVCNTCGADMKKFHPMQNIANHYQGICVTTGGGSWEKTPERSEIDELERLVQL